MSIKRASVDAQETQEPSSVTLPTSPVPQPPAFLIINLEEAILHYTSDPAQARAYADSDWDLVVDLRQNPPAQLFGDGDQEPAMPLPMDTEDADPSDPSTVL